PGPPVMIVSGAVLSTTIARVTTGDSFAVASVAITDNVCAPSASVVVSQTAEAVSVVAGGTRSSVVDRGRPAAFSLTLTTPLPAASARPETGWAASFVKISILARGSVVPLIGIERNLLAGGSASSAGAGGAWNR